ncbi:hypothetical protein [Rhodoferax sp. PAMC 29310]|uniref:hypothetical protein n=1 Tax=Rhodoferax sp. PAMC 29310 TaxID=2822760 RepID=UPI001B3193DB|nr:hypothetical protein [Rhodoferax sp. PAMC 29310]
MNKALKWISVTGLAAGVLVVGSVWGLQTWLGSADFKARVEREATQSLGVGVKLGGIEVSVFPKPAVVVTDIEVATKPALSLAYVGVRPELGRLLMGEWSVGSVLVRDASLPQHGIDALLLSLSKTNQPAQSGPGSKAKTSPKKSQAWFPRELLLKNVSWVNAKGLAMTVDFQADINAQGEPDKVNVQVLKGFLQGSTAQLSRQDRVWSVALSVGGGTVQGPVEFRVPSQPGGAYVLKGQLETKGVEVAALSTAAIPVLSGRLDASTTLSARTSQIDTLSDVLKSQSQFTVKGAVLHGIDLAKAVKTVGTSRGGNTSLDVLAGQVSTEGRVLQINNLVASSGVLSATGQVKVAASRALSGQISVNLAASQLGGAVGVPLEVGGTLDAPQVNLSRSALIGAAIGTVLMPGVGTGAGASVGDKVGEGLKKLFGR